MLRVCGYYCTEIQNGCPSDWHPGGSFSPWSRCVRDNFLVWKQVLELQIQHSFQALVPRCLEMCHCMLLEAEADKSFLMGYILDYVLRIVGAFWIPHFSRMSLIDEECQPLSLWKSDLPRPLKSANCFINLSSFWLIKAYKKRQEKQTCLILVIQYFPKDIHFL